MRSRLVDAAISEIGARGYAATTVGDVVTRAGCGRATFYRHFRDKEDCLLAAVDRAAGELSAELGRTTQSAKGVHAAHGLVATLVAYACDRQAPAQVLLLEALGGGPRVLSRRDRLIAEIERLLDDASRRARGDRRLLELPSAALVGGVFRLLAIRLHRRAIDRDELHSGFMAWIDSYLTSSPGRARTPHWFAQIPAPPNVWMSSVRAPPRLPRGRHRLDPAEVARNQHDRILYATLEAVYRFSYPATTVHDITACAGVSERTFYRHFRSRQQAAAEANELFFEHAMAATAGAFFAASGWPERVWAAGHTLTSFLAANPAVARSAFVEFHAVSPAAIQLAYDRLGAFTLFLDDGYTYREQNRELPRLCSEAISAVMFEFAYRAARRHPAAAELPTTLPVFVYVCLAPFLDADKASAFVQMITSDARHTRVPPSS